MRNIVLTIFVTLCLVSAAMAAETKQIIPFNNLSGASAAVQYSSVINVTKYPNKTLHVSGVNLAGTAFKNMSGTVIAQCSPTQGDPWSNVGRWQDSVGTAVSITANSNVTWRDYCNYIRLRWTAGTVGGKLKAWLSLSE